MKNIILFVIAVSLLGLGACHKCNDPGNPACSNYDPCYGKVPTTASFKMREFSDSTLLPQALQPYWKRYYSDSCNQQMIFTADLDSAIYEWHIGAGVYTSKSFSLNFSSVSVPSIIPVTLIVRKPHDAKCDPDGKDIDTVTQNLYVLGINMNKYLLGTYQGTFTDAPSTVSTFQLVRQPGFDPSYPNYYLVGFFAPGDSAQFDPDPTFHELYMRKQVFLARDPSCSHYFDVITYVDDDGNAECTFAINPPTVSSTQIRIFKGRKIQ
jgi:hypothetical protein